MVHTERGAHQPDVPLWVAGVATPSDEEFAAWDERERQRLVALEVLGYGLITGSTPRRHEGQRLLDDLPPAIRFEEVPATPDLLRAAVQGQVTTAELIDAYRAGSVELSDEQHEFIGDDMQRIRVLVLARKRDLGSEFLEEQLFPAGQPALALAARSSHAAARALAGWLQQHPELTGAGDVHWRA